MSRTGILFCLLLLFALGSVASTYTRLSRTADEGYNVYVGMQWWEKHRYDRELCNPPLGRVAAAAPVYWLNAQDRASEEAGVTLRDAALYRTALMRLGTLPFYLLSVCLVWVWSRRLFGGAAALWSVGFYILLPPVAAHAGMSNTDMAYTSMLLLALLAGIRWLENPGRGNSLLLGLSLGLMLSTKFSGLVQWPCAMLLIAAAQACAHGKAGRKRWFITRNHWQNGILCALPLMMLVIAAIYRFSLEQFFAGLAAARAFNEKGTSIWLFGPLPRTGVWYFFPVVFFFKTPLPFHIAAIIGNLRLRGGDVRCWFPLLAALGVLLPSMTSHINLGVRHVLPLYPLLAIPAGYGLLRLWQAGDWRRAACAGLLFWQAAGFAASWPDHLSYFNELAGSRPERVARDSDFDWGQNLILLDETLQEKGIDEIYLCIPHKNNNRWAVSAYFHAKTYPCPQRYVSGWIAVSRVSGHDFSWLNGLETVQSIGRTFDLYYVPAYNEER